MPLDRTLLDLDRTPTLDEKDRRILRMTMDGYTQDEIARAVGFANNSAISKRIANLRTDFVRKTGVKIE